MRYSSSLESLRFESLKQYSVRQRGQQPLDLSKDYPIPLNGVNIRPRAITNEFID